MEPKTALQKHAAAISARMKPISERANAWGLSAVFVPRFTTSRNTAYCLECGHSWKDKFLAKQPLLDACTCPACNKQLHRYNLYRRKAECMEYWSLVTVTGGVQVVRVTLAEQHMKKHQQATYSQTEVARFFIYENGRMVTVSKARLPLMGYWDHWVKNSRMEVRPLKIENDAHSAYFQIGLTAVYPRQRVLPVLLRNGFDGDFCTSAPQAVFYQLLNEPKIETLYKSGQKALLERFMAVGYRFNSLWSSVRIAIRHGYIVKDATLWADYIDLLKSLGRDTLNPVLVCPEDLHQAHRQALAAVRRRQAERERKARMERYKELREQMQQQEPEYQARMAAYAGFQLQDGEIRIVPLSTVAEVFNEGEALQHCVFVREYHLRKHSLLLSARIEGKPVETIEVDLNQYKILQARGMHNQPSAYNERIVRVLENHIPALRNMAQLRRNAS